MSKISSLQFDWQRGEVRALPSLANDGSREWSMVICGDWAPLSEHLEALIANPQDFYGDLLPVLQDTDLAVVNLENVLLNEKPQPLFKDGPAMCAPFSAVEGLTVVPFHLVCLANNHVFDYGKEGLSATLSVLAKHKLQCVGAGLTGDEAEAAKIFEFGKTRLAVLNVAEGEEARSVNGGPGAASLDLLRLQKQIATLREKADIITIIAHAGREHIPIPAPHIRRLYQSLVDAGADLVIGHHPHVPQGLEIYKDTLIVYSLGNFAFLMTSPLRYHRIGYFLKFRFWDAHLKSVEIWPYQIESKGLRLLTREQRDCFLADLKNLSLLAADDIRLNTVWNAFADHWLAKVGAQELADSLTLLGGGQMALKSVLRASLLNFEGPGLANRLGRSLIWRAVHWLESWGQPAPPMIKHGAAVLRNRLDTLTHQETYLTALRRVVEDKAGQSPEWAVQLLKDWNLL